jgi:hypothetical protein
MRSLTIAALLLTATAYAYAADIPKQVFFDDFTYSRREQMVKRGWIVRSVAGWPGVPGATWDAAGVTFASGVMRMTAATDGTAANTRQVQVCHQRKYLEGTYAARVRFSDDTLNGPDRDQVVQTFYMISPLREPLAPEYSELDVEYLPNGGWGRTGPTLFATTWETFRPEPNWKAVNASDSKAASYDGWHTFVIQVADAQVHYFVDGVPFATHGGDFYPESLMSLNFNLWFTGKGLGSAPEPRQYREEVDWVFHAAKKVLAPAEVEAAVTKFRKTSIAFRDTVPQAVPPLDSPCNF